MELEPKWAYVVPFVLPVLLLLLGAIKHLGGQSRALGSSSHPLDTVLFWWTPDDPYTVRHLVSGGLAIFGLTGAGKTSSSGKQLGRAIVQLPASGTIGSSGLILAAKPEDLALWQRLFADAGRSHDLLVFSPSQPFRFNFLDYQVQHEGQTRDIVRCLRILGESLQTQQSSGMGHRDEFFAEQEEMLLYNGVEIVKRATGHVSAPDLQRFITSAAQSRDDLTSDTWRASFHSECLEAAHAAPKALVEQHDFALAIDYWLRSFPTMAEKTRSCILAGVLGTLHVFNTGLVRELVSGETNLTPDTMQQGRGRWVLVNMSPAEFGSAGTFICAGWRYLTQRMVLRRVVGPQDPVNVIWVDEFPQHANSFDAQYVCQSRSHLGCMVVLGQTLPGYYAAFRGESHEHQAQSLLSNFSHTVVHAVDPITAEWAAKKLGRQREAFFGGSATPAEDVFDEVFGRRRTTGSFSEHYEQVLQERVLMNGLRTGGPANGGACDALVIRAGEPFSTGENFLRTTFYQE